MNSNVFMYTSGKSAIEGTPIDTPLVFYPKQHRDRGQVILLSDKSITKLLGEITLHNIPSALDNAIREGLERNLPVAIAANGKSARVLENEKEREFYERFLDDGNPRKTRKTLSQRKKLTSIEELIENSRQSSENASEELQKEYTQCFNNILGECNGMDDLTELHRTLYSIKNDKIREELLENIDDKKMNDLAHDIFNEIKGNLQNIENIKFRDKLHDDFRTHKMFIPSSQEENYRTVQKIGSEETQSNLTEKVRNVFLNAVINDQAIQGYAGGLINLNGANWAPRGAQSNFLFYYAQVLNAEYIDRGVGDAQRLQGVNNFITAINANRGVVGNGIVPWANIVNLNAIGLPTPERRALIEAHRLLYPNFAYKLNNANPPVAVQGGANPAVLNSADMEQVKTYLERIKALPLIAQPQNQHLKGTLSGIQDIASLMTVTEQAQTCITPETSQNVLNSLTRKNNLQWQTLLECMTPIAPAPPNYTLEPEHALLFRKMPKNIKTQVKTAIAGGGSSIGNAALQAAYGPNAFEQQLANADVQCLENIFTRLTVGRSKAELLIKNAGEPRHKKRSDLSEGIQGYLRDLDAFSYKASKQLKTVPPMTRI